MLTVCGMICRTMRGPFGGLHEEALPPWPSRLHLLRRRPLALRPQRARHQGIIKNRRELRQVVMGFRARHLQRRPEYSKGRIGLGVREDEQQVVGHGGQGAFATTAWFAPARSGREPFFLRLLLRCLREVAEDGPQVVAWGLGQAGQSFHLTLVSDVQSHRLASSMAFWRTAYLILYWGTTLKAIWLGGKFRVLASPCA
jgi:hypothetical protein